MQRCHHTFRDMFACIGVHDHSSVHVSRDASVCMSVCACSYMCIYVFLKHLYYIFMHAQG